KLVTGVQTCALPILGQGLYAEIDFQPRASIGGENYGWRRMEATHCYDPATKCGDPTFTMPILEYSHNDGSCSVTGGYRYRGVRLDPKSVVQRQRGDP